MIAKVLDVVFGCRHSQYSFPITMRRSARLASQVNPSGTYVVCMDCGKELPYDWQKMRVTDYHPASRPIAVLTTKQAA
jgi:hypothetical protein